MPNDPLPLTIPSNVPRNVVSFMKTAMDPDHTKRPSAAELLEHEFVALSTADVLGSGYGAPFGSGSTPLARVNSGEEQKDGPPSDGAGCVVGSTTASLAALRQTLPKGPQSPTPSSPLGYHRPLPNVDAVEDGADREREGYRTDIVVVKGSAQPSSSSTPQPASNGKTSVV